MQDKGSRGDSFQLSFYDGITETARRTRAFQYVDFDDGLRYCRFDIEKISTNEKVYDITVEGDHSFSVAGVVVHNCSGVYIGDSVDSFYSGLRENAILSKNGFGTSTYLGDIRPRGSDFKGGGKASGVLPVLKDQITMAQTISQGSSRRGSVGQYLEIDHGDFYEVADYLFYYPDDANVGWVLTEEWLDAVKSGDEDALRRYQRVLKIRSILGKGYLMKKWTVNEQRPQMYKDLGFEIKASNLCSEVMLYQDEDHSFSCVLSSMNLAMWDEWKDTDAVFHSTVFLDCVAEHFIRQGREIPGLEKVVRFTEKGRALGLGVLGWHTYLQKNRIVWGDFQSMMLNAQIFKHIHDESLKASQWMAKEWGEPEWCKGYGVRNTHRTALPPTLSTALLVGGISQGIEPVAMNVFSQTTAAGTVRRINPVLLEIMQERGVYNRDTLRGIEENAGSVSHVDWLDDHEKEVFKTAFEINQLLLLQQASQRQPFICQGQSLNLFFAADESEEWISEVTQEFIEDPNLNALYYQRSMTNVKASKGECLSCHA